MIDSNSIEVLEEIVRRKGDCLSYDTCIRCPFAQKCLTSFVVNKSRHARPSKEDRFNLALDALTKHVLMEDDQEFVHGS